MIDPRGGCVSLAFSLINIIQHLRQYGHLQIHVLLAMEQVKALQPNAKAHMQERDGAGLHGDSSQLFILSAVHVPQLHTHQWKF